MNKKKKTVLIILAATALLLAAWTVWGNLTVGVTRYKITSERLPESFNHYKIAVVSDLHNAEFGKNNSTLVNKITKEHPDMIAITGDIVDYNRTDIETAKTLVRQLAEIAPCYYVTGNNEAALGERYAKLKRVLLQEGVIILHDEYVRLTKNNEFIILAGLDDPDFRETDASVQQSMLKSTLRDMKLPDGYRVLLSHRPEAFDAYVSENVDLVLSGHAHGGQFRLPFIGGVIAPDQGLFPKYDAGNYCEGQTVMIVSRGIGNSIIPIRINNRPEIVCVELVCID